MRKRRRWLGPYVGENFPRPVVEVLRRLGHDVLTSQEAGQSGRQVPDQQVLASAQGIGRAVLTLDRRHYIRLHRQDPGHSGIIACTYDPDFAAQAVRIDAAISSQDELAAQLIRFNRPTR